MKILIQKKVNERQFYQMLMKVAFANTNYGYNGHGIKYLIHYYIILWFISVSTKYYINIKKYFKTKTKLVFFFKFFSIFFSC